MIWLKVTTNQNVIKYIAVGWHVKSLAEVVGVMNVAMIVMVCARMIVIRDIEVRNYFGYFMVRGS